jgi:hypothetical protein
MQRKLFFIPVLLFPVLFLSFCTHVKVQLPEIEKTSIWQNYDRYKEKGIQDRFFKHAEMVPLIQKHVESKIFSSKVLGYSTQNRSINLVTAGKGKIKVLLWSQMHGDESTATMALFDVFNFLAANDEDNDFRKLLLDQLELNFLPMVNPDGAEIWKRRSALQVDINRDARLLNTPEAKILTAAAVRVNPQFGFNLHDQSIHYAAGSTKNQAAISFLAPAFNEQKDINPVREKAMKLIVMMNRTLQKYVPGKIAKYDDAFDPRCFGDTFQGRGISTVLIESGGYPNDPEKQYIRKLNFYVILSSLHAIAEAAYEHENTKDYVLIPENNRSLFDLMIRNAEITHGDFKFRTHLGISRTQVIDSGFKHMYYRGSIEELGDMTKHYGYEEVDAFSLISMTGKIKVMTKASWEKMPLATEISLLKQGFLFVKFSDQKSPTGPIKNRLLNLTNSVNQNPQLFGLGQNANFILAKQSQPVYAVVNGYLIDLSKNIEVLPNVHGY